MLNVFESFLFVTDNLEALVVEYGALVFQPTSGGAKVSTASRHHLVYALQALEIMPMQLRLQIRFSFRRPLTMI
jgi:hypothetical protein